MMEENLHPMLWRSIRKRAAYLVGKHGGELLYINCGPSATGLIVFVSEDRRVLGSASFIPEQFFPYRILGRAVGFGWRRGTVTQGIFVDGMTEIEFTVGGPASAAEVQLSSREFEGLSSIDMVCFQIHYSSRQVSGFDGSPRQSFWQRVRSWLWGT